MEWSARIERRGVMAGMAATALGSMARRGSAESSGSRSVVTGATRAARDGFAQIEEAARRRGPVRVGLVTNQTGRVGERHLVDLIAAASRVRLTAILAPEHGFRGQVEAGARVTDARDAKTGVPIFSLYGQTRRPTPRMLADVDVLVFDIQDIGARFYTYISTMGLAMQAAAAARIPFVVLDRPNPLGCDYVSGFVREPIFASFVGQYPIPIVHGMTVGELAGLIKGEAMLDGLADLVLEVVECEGRTRQMRWPQTGLPWVPTSPNIPSFESALAYPGVGIIGETQMNEGRGTPIPFQQFGAPWLDAARLADDLGKARLPGVRFEAARVTPRSIPQVAASPRFVGEEIAMVRLVVEDGRAFQPLEVGIHALALLQRQARAAGVRLLPEKVGMLNAIAGTTRLVRMLSDGSNGAGVTANWAAEVARFRDLRERYMLA